MYQRNLHSTPEQIEMLRRWAADAVPVERMAAEFGTSHHVLKRWAREAGFSLNGYRKEVLRARQEAADGLLRELYPTDVEWPELIRRYCEVVGGERTRSAVTSRAHDLGLKRPKNFLAGQKARNAKLAEKRRALAARVQPLVDAGMGMIEAGRQLGICRAVMGRMRREGLIVLRTRHPAEKPPPKTAWSQEQMETVKRMWAEGASSREIGAAVGRGRHAVLGVVHRMGLPRRHVVAAEPKVSRRRPPKSPQAPSALALYARPQPQDKRRVQALLGRRVAFDEDMGPAIEEWIAENGVRRCPAAAVAVTSARLADDDVAALREYSAAMAPQGDWKQRQKTRQWRSW